MPIWAQSISVGPSVIKFNDFMDLRSDYPISLSLSLNTYGTGNRPAMYFRHHGIAYGSISVDRNNDFILNSSSNNLIFRTYDNGQFVDALTLIQNGNIGLGPSEPEAPLHIMNSNSVKILLANPTEGVGSGIIKFKDVGSIGEYNSFLSGFFDMALISEKDTWFKAGDSLVQRIDTRGNVTINPRVVSNIIFSTYASARANLDVNNTIRSAELDFTETASTERRPVFADKDGILRIESTSNHYASYNFTSVHPQNSTDSYTKGSGYAWFNTNDAQKTFYLPVNLPDGVKITNVRMYLKDNSNSNLSLTFYRNEHLSNNFITLASAQSNTNNNNLFSINSSLSETVDNQNNSYYVNVTSVGNWTSNTLQFHSLVITYQYQ